MLATISSATLLGAYGRAVTVEVHVAGGLPGYTVVGLPDDSCRESRDRVRAALSSSGCGWPQQRITVNLAPSGMRKGGSGLDLAIAVGVVVASGNLPPRTVEGFAFLGELGLDGSVRRVPGIVPLAGALAAESVVVPAAAAHEAAVVAAGRVRPVHTLAELLAALKGDGPWPPMPPAPDDVDPPPPLELADVRGQEVARQALCVAAAGGHHLLLVGSPGSGKTMLAQRLPGLLPPLDAEAALTATIVHSAANVALPPGGLVRQAPFRAPHHTASVVSLVGGGTPQLRPGEVSLATGGVLFLDELGEFSPSVLDALREPLEEGVVRVARARAAVDYPARLLLVAAMNPCPCGAGGPPGSCDCVPASRARYMKRVSGPLLDRFDLRLEVRRPSVSELLDARPVETTAQAAARVALARRRASARGFERNADIPSRELDNLAPLSAEASRVLRTALERGRLTGRGLHRVRRVALTVADLDGRDPPLDAAAVLTALSMRIDPLASVRRIA
ncbi:MAG TPA: YifB family Mg chelatase-like AAA ATPase [Acidimicrobiales bacterium]